MALVLVWLLASPASASRRQASGPTIVIAVSGDLSQGALLRAMSRAVPGPAGALLRRVWWRQQPSMELPSGQTLLPGGVPIGFQMSVPGSATRQGPAHLVETARQRRVFGMLGLETVSTFNYFKFRRVDSR